MSEIIRLENISKVSYVGRRVINNLSLAINERERVVICGPSGCGKTSLLRLIAGMDRPDSGQAFVVGQPVHEMSADDASAFRNLTMGVCLRDPALMPSLSICENVALPLAIRGIPAARRRKAAMDQLQAFGVAYVAHAKATALSAYERKLASLARALVNSPQVLLLDEITADLPERDSRRLIDVLGVISNFQDTALVFSTSGEGFIPNVDRRFILNYGKIMEENL